MTQTGKERYRWRQRKSSCAANSTARVNGNDRRGVCGNSATHHDSGSGSRMLLTAHGCIEQSVADTRREILDELKELRKELKSK